MTNIKRNVVAIALALMIQLTAFADFRVGLKAGAALDKLSLDTRELTSRNNCAGFTGGLMAEFTVPIIGIGADVSVLYARRTVELIEVRTDAAQTYNRDYIDVPVNFKWKIALPVIKKVIIPFVTTGPDFSVLCTKDNLEDAWTRRKVDIAWNVGAGVELFQHLQLAASYGFGISNSASGDEALNGGSTNGFDDLKNLDFSGKDRFWTLTLTYLF